MGEMRDTEREDMEKSFGGMDAGNEEVMKIHEKRQDDNISNAWDERLWRSLECTTCSLDIEMWRRHSL